MAWLTCNYDIRAWLENQQVLGRRPIKKDCVIATPAASCAFCHTRCCQSVSSNETRCRVGLTVARAWKLSQLQWLTTGWAVAPNEMTMPQMKSETLSKAPRNHLVPASFTFRGLGWFFFSSSVFLAMVCQVHGFGYCAPPVHWCWILNCPGYLPKVRPSVGTRHCSLVSRGSKDASLSLLWSGDIERELNIMFCPDA